MSTTLSSGELRIRCRRGLGLSTKQFLVEMSLHFRPNERFLMIVLALILGLLAARAVWETLLK